MDKRVEDPEASLAERARSYGAELGERSKAFYAEDAKKEFRVSATYLRREQVLVNFSMEAFISDHPKGLGGDNMGPSPGELLMGSLAACTAIYVGRNARRLKIPLESVDVKVKFEVGHERIEGPLHALSFLSRIAKVTEIRGNLTEEQFATLKFFADNCAIGETLRRGVMLDETVTWVNPAAAETVAAAAETVAPAR
jgi:putative redox protein